MAQRGGRRMSYISRATPAAVPVQFGQCQCPSVSKGYRVSTRRPAVLGRLGSHSQERKSSSSFRMRGIHRGRKAGTMGSVERRDLLFGAFMDKRGFLGTHSVLGIILSPRESLRVRKMRLPPPGEIILLHSGEATVKGTCRCLKSPLTGPLWRLLASVSL